MDQKSNKSLWWVVGLVIMVVAIYFAVAGSSTPSSIAGKTIKIGFIGPLSGDAAAIGEEMQKTVSYRVKQINDQSGEKGVKFDVVFEDGKCSGADAVAAFQKLINIDGVEAILGGACSSETLGIAPLADQNEVLLVSGVSSNPKIEGIGKYTFSLSYSDKKIGEDLAKQMSSYKRVAIITEQNDYNIGIRDTFLNELKQSPSATVVANETFPKGASDFRNTLEKVRQASPDAILLNPNVGVTAENLLRQMAEMKMWTGYKLFGQFAYLLDPARASAGKFSEGMIIIDAPNVNSQELLAEEDAIKKDQGGTLDNLGHYYTASTLDAINLITGLIAKDGNDTSNIQDELSSGKFKGYIGDIEFDGHNFVRLTLSGKYVVQNGKAVLQSEQ